MYNFNFANRLGREKVEIIPKVYLIKILIETKKKAGNV